MPGHLIRRAHQIANAIFENEMPGDITPIQYAILRLLQDHPGIDQVTLARMAALDNSTAASVAVRLESKGLLLRKKHPVDRRQRCLEVTAEGLQRLSEMVDAVHRARDRLLAPFSETQRAQFMRLLEVLVEPGAVRERPQEKEAARESALG